MTPSPSATLSLAFHDTAGLTLIVLISDLSPWKRPIQPLSYSVTSPKGAFTPTPTDHCLSSGIVRYRFGTKFKLPASPPLSPSGCWAAACDAPSLNFIEGWIRFNAPATWPVPSLAMPAALVHTVAASSAAAAPPA